MNAIDELVATANSLCERLEAMSNEDKRFCADVQLWLQNQSWDMYRMANNLKEISKFLGE